MGKIADALAGAASKKIDISGVKSTGVIGEDKVEKVGIFGHPGTGKTLTLMGPLLAGQKVLIASLDLGTDGTECLVDYAIVNNCERSIQPDVLQNVVLTNYQEVHAFLHLDTPRGHRAEAMLPAGWVPDVIMLDGFSSFNVDYCDEYMLVEHKSKEMKDNDLREDGLAAGMQDWGGIKRLTLRGLRKFMALKIGGKRQHKFITYLQAAGKTDDSGAALKMEQAREGPLVQGTGRQFANVPVDLFIKTSRVIEGGKPHFYYDIAGDSSKTAVKRRGHSNLPDRMEADPVKLWKMIRREEVE